MNPTLINIQPKDNTILAFLESQSKANALNVQDNVVPLKPWLRIAGLDLTEHGQRVDAQAIDEMRFKLFNDNELAEREIFVERGQIVYSTNKLVLSTTKKIMWLMHDNGRIFAEYGVEGSIFHSSLAAKKNPIAAGEMFVKEGRIVLINEISGHYMKGQTSRIEHVLSELKSRGYLQDIPVATPPSVVRHSKLNERRKLKVNTPVVPRRSLASVLPVILPAAEPMVSSETLRHSEQPAPSPIPQTEQPATQPQPLQHVEQSPPPPVHSGQSPIQITLQITPQLASNTLNNAPNVPPPVVSTAPTAPQSGCCTIL